MDKHVSGAARGIADVQDLDRPIEDDVRRHDHERAVAEKGEVERMDSLEKVGKGTEGQENTNVTVETTEIV